jgi:hypothetical protein
VKLIDDLRAEHDLIEQVVGSLRTYVNLRVQSGGLVEDGARFLEFFRKFAGDFHHAKEEHTLFPALQAQADLPREGPIEVLTDDHRRLGGVLAEIASLLERAVLDEEGQARLQALAIEYSARAPAPHRRRELRSASGKRRPAVEKRGSRATLPADDARRGRRTGGRSRPSDQVPAARR